MGISETLNRRVRARPADDDDESIYSGESEIDNGAHGEDGESDAEDQQSRSV